MVKSIDSQQVESLSVDALVRRLESSGHGLSAAEAQQCLLQFGRNALEEKKLNPLARFRGYFWGPIPWRTEVAAALSELVRHWEDFTIILVHPHSPP